MEPRPCSPEEFAALRLAAQLEEAGRDSEGRMLFRHSSGPEITVLEEEMVQAFRQLQECWPLSQPVSELFDDPQGVREDLESLCRQELLELRLVEPGENSLEPGALHEFEGRIRQCLTSPRHRLFAPPSAE